MISVYEPYTFFGVRAGGSARRGARGCAFASPCGNSGGVSASPCGNSGGVSAEPAAAAPGGTENTGWNTGVDR